MTTRTQPIELSLTDVTGGDQFKVRPATLDDIKTALELANTCDQAVAGIQTNSEVHFRVRWTSPDGDLALDSRVIETIDGRMAAFVHLNHRPPFIEVWVTAYVHPDFQQRGIGKAICAWVQQRAEQLIPQAPEDARVLLVTGLIDANDHGARLLTQHGLEVSRHFVRMITDYDFDTPEPVWPGSVELRPVDRKVHDRAICLAHVEAFRDHWGHVDRTEDQDYEQWCHWITNDEELDEDLWFVAWDGDQVAGMSICWPKTDGDPTIGYIGILCVLRQWRGQGLGLALMHHSYKVFKERGYPRVALHADAENITGALKLYRRAGMEIDQRFDFYEKELRPGKDLRVMTLEESA